MDDFGNIRGHWQLDPSVDFLNHGSFGATPTVVLQTQRAFQDALEREPLRFLAPERDLEPKLDLVRELVARQVGVDAGNLARVRNATDAVNAVLRSFPFSPGDEMIVTNHGYNACNNAAFFAAERAGARVRVAKIPFPIRGENEVLSSIEAELTDRTRLLLIDHVTSVTGMVLPIQRIMALAKSSNVRVMVDGAHSLGMLPIDLAEIDADYYTSNHHKWLCGPKVSGFLYVRPELQSEVRPTVISHAANTPRPTRSRFLAEFDWTGTYDPSPWLSVPAAIEFLESQDSRGLRGVMEVNRDLALKARKRLIDALGIEPPVPESMIGSLASLPLPPATELPPPGKVDPLQTTLFQRHRIEVPVYNSPVPKQRLIRISAHLYNDISQYERLANALSEELSGL